MNRARRRRRRGKVIAVRTGRDRAVLIAEDVRGRIVRYAFVNVAPGGFEAPVKVTPALAAFVRNQGQAYAHTFFDVEDVSAITGGHAR